MTTLPHPVSSVPGGGMAPFLLDAAIPPRVVSGVALEEVTLVAAVDRIPETAEHWPVRVVRAVDCPQGVSLTYICGRWVDAQPFLDNFEQGLLGLILDVKPESLPESLDVQVLPSLCCEGHISFTAWEGVVRAVCSRHVETIQETIFRHARQTPEKLALVYEERHWTYQQLVSMAVSLGERLRHLGLEPSGGPLAVQLQSSDVCTICYLALCAAAHVFQLVDSHPQSRKNKLDACPCQALVCETGTCLKLLDPSLPIINIDKFELDKSRPTGDLRPGGGLGNALFIEYTSGSTGLPKSVCVTSWRIAHWWRWRQFHFPLRVGGERVGHNLFNSWYWHLPLVEGGVSVLYPTPLNTDVSALMRYARSHGVNRFDCLTPGLISALLEVEETLPDSLTMTFSGGEALPMSTCREWLRRWPQCKLVNNFAATETSSDISFCCITPDVVARTMLYAPVTDGIIAWQNKLEVVDGELVIRGWNIGAGYLPPTQSDAFRLSPDGLTNEYRTGDRAEWIGDKLFMTGRIDSVVKVRGHRVDLAGMEAIMSDCPAAADIACVAHNDTVCCLVVTKDMPAVHRFSERMPNVELVVWYLVTELPYSSSGKRDRNRILAMFKDSAQTLQPWVQPAADGGSSLPGGAPATCAEVRVAAEWRAVLGRTTIGRTEPFFEAGGHSLAAMKLAKRLGLQPAEIIAFPTVAAMAARLSVGMDGPTPGPAKADDNHKDDLVVAIVGMAGRFPGAPSVAALWEALEAGRDLISTVPAQEGYVPRKGVVADQGFDHAFWGLSREAATFMDSTQRAMLETAYEALEDAGMDPFNAPGRVGVVVCGGSLPHHASEVLGIDLDESRAERPDEYFALEIGIDKDYLATQVSFRLDLRGPSEVVQTACSSGLVAVARAVQMLRLRMCDYVVCGGGSFSPDGAIRKVDGMIWSPDGVCRPFAEGANGTVNADGCGLVVLTTLDSAQRRGERVYATVLGVATNNDGARKAGFSAPSFEGQVEVLRAAHADAGISSAQIDYIEAHGTGTKLGDPLEVQAISEALGPCTHGKNVVLGSVKGNIGHMNTAAGVPGLIKSVLMLHHQRMVPSLHTEKPSSLIDWGRLPLRLSTASGSWDGSVAAVSSFGIGGTNAHVVVGALPQLQEKELAVAPVPGRAARPHLLLVSAKTLEAAQEGQRQIADFCAPTAAAADDASASPGGRDGAEGGPPPALAEVEATLLSRPRFGHRCFALGPEDLRIAPVFEANKLPVVLLFPGQGGAYPGMGCALEETGLLPCGRDWADGVGPADVVKASLAVAWALERQGLKVQAVVGHSVGEWAAAAFAGVVSVEEALRLAELRGQLMNNMEPGAMISVRAPTASVEDLLAESGGVEVACINGREAMVLAGPETAMSNLQVALDRRNLPWKKLATSRAFHTAAVDPILPAYAKGLEGVAFSTACIPILSNVSGDWHGTMATTAQYWLDHLRRPVRFYDNLRHIAERFPSCVVVEVGPSTLAGVVAHEVTGLGVDWKVIATMRPRDEVETYLRCLGTLWGQTDLLPILPSSGAGKISLPTYAFRRTAMSSEPNAGKSSRFARSSQAQIVQQRSTGATVPPKIRDPVESGFFYEALDTPVEVSCIEPQEAAVVLDGDVLPTGLPPRAIIAAADRAVVAARASGVLLYVGNSDAPPVLDDISQEELILSVIALLDQLAKARARLEIFFVLRANLRYAALWGLLRSAAREHPELRLRRLLREEGAPLLLPALPVELTLRPSGAHALRLHPVPTPVAKPDRHVYSRALVTGGLRGLGVKVAQWLLATGRATSLVLAGRNQPQGDAAMLVEQLQAAAHVEIRICDVSEWTDVCQLPDCDLVLHVAGNVKDGLLVHATKDDVQRVLRPKVRGALHLRQRFPEARILGFSSSSGLFGAVGQATYAAANTFLDTVMPTVQWGGWAEAGMAVDLGIVPEPGERFFPVSVGLDCLGRALDCSERSRPFCLIDVDWGTYRLNASLFAPSDPLIGNIGAMRVPARSLLGVSCRLGDSLRGWELILGPEGSRYQGACSAWEICQQHVVGQTPMFPATGFVALALEATKEVGAAHATLTNISFLRPLELASSRQLTTTLVHGEGGAGSIRFESRPIREDDGTAVEEGDTEATTPTTLHCTCNFAPSPEHKEVPIHAPLDSMNSVADLYREFDAVGFHYGPAFRTTDVVISVDRTVAQCRVPQFPGSPFQLHPAAVDAGMHLLSLLHPLGCRGVPQRIRRLSGHNTMSAASARAAIVGGEGTVQLLDSGAQVVCSIEGLELAALEAPPSLQLCRRMLSTMPPEPRSGAWLIHGDEAAALDLPLATCCEAEPHTAEAFAVSARTLSDVQCCREKARLIAARSPCWVIALEAPLAEAAAAAAAEVGARAIIGTASDVRTVAPGLGLNGGAVLRARNGEILTEALEPQTPAVFGRASPSDPFSVSVDPSKGAKGASCHLTQRREPDAQEVELRASIWALNFRDVLVAVGAIPMEVAGQALGIGGECYGEVVRVGSGVHDFSVGDVVVALPPEGMGSYVTVQAQWVMPAPAQMTPEQAVAGTMAYATAWLGLHWQTQISKGERVLVHSAAGGVGLAAVHLCLREGCTVYATASTPEKRALLLSLGVAAAFNSRSPAEFEYGVLEVTNGEGVDVVLNSLGGDAIDASLRLLRPFGRFLELGKRDQYEDKRIGLGHFLNSLTYAAVHIDVLMLKAPNRCRKLLEVVWRELPGLPMLPTTSFGMKKLSNALEYFSKGVHIGKVLVSIGEDVPVLPARPATVAGLHGDAVAASVRVALAAKDGLHGVVCVPTFKTLAAVEDLVGARVVITGSRAVAAVATFVCPEALCVELPRWEPIGSLDSWLAHRGHVVATEQEEREGNLHDWLVEVVGEMAGPVGMNQTFESVGLDSLSLISLARRLTSKIGRTVSVLDLYDHPTPQRLLDSLVGDPQKQLVRAKVVCLHGFRTNKDIMSLQCAQFVSAVGFIEWIFVNSPRHASGPTDPKIPSEVETFEWWGEQDGPYETGWMSPHFGGLSDTLSWVDALKPVGVVGFSQGAAVAALAECAWVALFSAVMPPGLGERTAASFHAFDKQEDIASQCLEVADRFSDKVVHHHSSGHNIPDDPAIIQGFAEFASRQCAKGHWQSGGY